MPTPTPPLRLNKFLAERLGLSRREADELIEAGRVLLNEKPAVLGARVDKNDKVWYNGGIVPFETDFLYVAFNKPVGYVCSRRAQGPVPTLYEILPKKYQKLKTVGRLDKDSSGLILLTNDGDFAFQMTHPKFHKNKVYEVTLDRPLEPLHQQEISDFGVKLDDGVSKFTVVRDLEWREKSVKEDDLQERLVKKKEPAEKGDLRKKSAEKNELDDRKHFIVTLSEGRNRQIRRTFAALGYKVVGLNRVQFGKYQLNGLKVGNFIEVKP